MEESESERFKTHLIQDSIPRRVVQLHSDNSLQTLRFPIDEGLDDKDWRITK